MLTLTFLGTSAARPTVERSVSAIALHREGETLLFDCGEGTQRQMMKYGVGFTLSDVFFTHFHSDHYLGFVGLVRTLGLQGRTEPMSVWGPKGAHRILGVMLDAGYERSPFEVVINEVEPGQVLNRGEYDLEVLPADHGSHAVGWVLRERDRLGRFDPDKARELGIPEGPLWGRIHKGETITVEGGKAGSREVRPEDLVGPPRPGRLVVISGDTRPSETLVRLAEGADLLVHEATFSHEEQDRAVETKHSTAQEAAQVALAARVRRLVLTHVSARFSVGAETLQDEARAVFPETVVARDGLEVDVPFTER
ncbi:MAG: ribonuclease Z [Gemmatimonadales bacterium]